MATCHLQTAGRYDADDNMPGANHKSIASEVTCGVGVHPLIGY